MRVEKRSDSEYLTLEAVEATTENTKMRTSSMVSRSSSIETPWSWVIMISSFIIHAIMYGLFWSVGVYYVVFLEEFGEGAGPTAWIGATQSAMVYFSGPLASVLSNRFGYRPMMVAGTLLATLGWAVSMFANSIYYLYFTYGVMVGLGFGIAYVPSITAVGDYFDRHRTVAIGIACSGAGAGTFVFPRLIRLLVALYGWRGSLLLMGGISMNIIICAMVMIPSPVIISDENRNKKLIKKDSNHLFNYHILIKKRYLLLCVSQLLFFFGIAVLYGHLSSYAKIKLSVENDNVTALLFSYMGLANFGGRLLFGLIGHHRKINVILAYIAATSIASITVGCLPFADTFTRVIAITVVFGIFSGCIGSYTPDLVIAFLDIHHLASGYGCLLIYEGIGTLLGGPVAGWLFDLTLNYDISFFVGGGAMVIASLILLPTYRCMKPSPHEPEIIADDDVVFLDVDLTDNNPVANV